MFSKLLTTNQPLISDLQMAKMDFLGIAALDKPSYNLSQHFEETTQFLQVDIQLVSF